MKFANVIFLLQKKEDTTREYLRRFSNEVDRNNYGKEYQEWLKQQRLFFYSSLDKITH